MAQRARPDGDEYTGGWSPPPLWERLDEVPPDDGDHVTSPALPPSATFVVHLGPLSGPIAGRVEYEAHPIELVARLDGTTCSSAVVALVEGGAGGDRWIKSQRFALSPGFQDYTLSPSYEEAARIEDYTALKLLVMADADGSSCSSSSSNSGSSSSSSGSESSSSSSSSSFSSSSGSDSSSGSKSSSNASAPGSTSGPPTEREPCGCYDVAKVVMSPATSDDSSAAVELEPNRYYHTSFAVTGSVYYKMYLAAGNYSLYGVEGTAPGNASSTSCQVFFAGLSYPIGVSSNPSFDPYPPRLPACVSFTVPSGRYATIQIATSEDPGLDIVWSIRRCSCETLMDC